MRLAMLGAAGLALIIGASWLIIGAVANGRVHTEPAALPASDVAIVPGALVFSNGVPSTSLSDRVDAAAALYHDGIVDHLLVSGDNSIEQYNEPVAMRERAMSLGVPAKDITLDYAGLDTWDTCLRANEQFGITSAVLVTQRLYASRAAALCETAGIDVAVLGIDRPPLRTSLRWAGRVRETLAKVKAVGDIARTPDAQFGGPAIGLVGSVNMPASGHPPDWDWAANAPAAETATGD